MIRWLPPAVCPKCNGQGHVNTPPHVAGDAPSYVTSDTTFSVCRVCSGEGLVWPPAVRPLVFADLAPPEMERDAARWREIAKYLTVEWDGDGDASWDTLALGDEETGAAFLEISPARSATAEGFVDRLINDPHCRTGRSPTDDPSRRHRRRTVRPDAQQENR